MLNSDQQPQRIKLISECFVKPKHEVAAAKQPYYLGSVDLGMLPVDPIQKGLLFTLDKQAQESTKISINNHYQSSAIVERLQHSMSIALIHFYPLAGRFVTEKYEDEHSCLIYVDCNKGPGARLIHAAMDQTVSDILSPTDVPLVVRSFFDLGDQVVNHDCHTKPILSIQVTELLDGVFIGFTMSHSVVDGTSFSHFITVLSQIFRCDDEGEYTLPASCVPLYKQFCPDGYGPLLKLPYLEPEEFIITRGYDPGPLRERIFHFSPASMAKLKAKANEECGSNNITSFLALSALVWRSITRARGLSLDQETSCGLAVNARNRIEPPLSQSHFGNIIAFAICNTVKASDLLDHNLGWVAMILRQEVDKCTQKRIFDFLKIIFKVLFGGPRSSLGLANKVTIGGSPRFDMYGAEFGLGRAVAVRMGYGNKDNGKVTASQGQEGGGSVELEVCLKLEIMSALEVDEEFMSFVS